MASPSGSILPSSYFDGLSSLWGACAYVGSAIVTAGLVFQAVRMRPDPLGYIWLFAKVFLIAVVTLFIREWLMRLNDIVILFAANLGVDPTQVDEKFITFISGKTAAAPDSSVWDVIWGTKSIGTAICYALLWLFGWLAWGVQYIVKVIGGVLLTAGWALSPLFIAMFMIRPMSGVALRYILGLVGLVLWPFGWVIAGVVTNAMIDAAATASLFPVAATPSMVAGPALTVLLIGAWMIISSALAPYITTKVLMMGANPAAALAQGVGGVAQATFAGGVGAATTALTGGAGTLGIITAAALGAVASGAESSARGGGSARTTTTAMNGLAGMYGSRDMRRRTVAHERGATAFSDMAESAKGMAAERAEQTEIMREMRRNASRQQRGSGAQPHHEDPNQAAVEIEVYAKK